MKSEKSIFLLILNRKNSLTKIRKVHNQDLIKIIYLVMFSIKYEMLIIFYYPNTKAESHEIRNLVALRVQGSVPHFKENEG